MTDTPRHRPTKEEAEAAVRTLIEWAGDDPDREGLTETPGRVTRSYRELPLRFAEAEGFDEVHDIVLGRCSMCHAAEPAWEGLLWAPKGVRLETEGQIARAAREIYLQAGVSHGISSTIRPAPRKPAVAALPA